MSVMKQKPVDLPPDAVILTQNEALAYQLDLIRDWDKISEVWPLRWGINILGLAGSLAGIYINDHYRRKLKLRNIGFITTYLPIVVLPGMLAGVFHKTFITPDVILENSKCPLCLQAKAAGIQAGVGFIYPILLAPFSSFMYATRHGTYRLPDITSMKGAFGSIKLLVKLGRPVGMQLAVIFIAQGLLGSYFTYLEAKSLYTIKQRMSEIEREYEESK